jgi:catechol 2,3-dioxygenase-like lactoylglutathione lyase family enzyme
MFFLYSSRNGLTMGFMNQDPTNAQGRKARAVGINHIALEVGNIAEALAFYGQFLEFELESQSETAAFIYFGDQFINFALGRTQEPDNARHFGIAVDNKPLVREIIESMGVEILDPDSRFLDFLDPWGNRVEITTYTNIQFSKADHVLKGMGLDHLKKTDEAKAELREKGMACDS